MRVRRSEGRSVVSGWDGTVGVVATTLLTLSVAAYAMWAFDARAWAIAVVLASLGLGSGYRVVLRKEEVVVYKTWLGIPWRRRRYGASARPDLYWAWEDREPSGVVMVDDGPREHEELWIFGRPKVSEAILAKLREELAYVRDGA